MPPPTMDADTAIRCRRDVEGLLVHGEPAEKKQILRAWVAEMKLAPEQLQVVVTYRIPEPVMNGVVAGACYTAMHNALAAVLVRRWTLPRNGRRG